MSFFFAFFESSAQRCQSSWELGHGINSWCHFGCVTNPPNRVVPQQHTLAISVSAGQHCTRLPQSLTGGRGLSSPAASTRGGLGGGSANSAPAALRLPGRGSRFHGRFSSKHASWEGSCVCRGETSWSFLRARPHPEEGGWFSLPSRPGPQGAGICQACLEPASYSNCPPRLGLLHPCVTLFVFLWIYHGYPKSFLLKSPTWISAVSTLLFISTIMGLSWSSVYISICSFISLCFISHSSKSGFLELRLLRSSYVVWHPRWTFFSFGRVCRVACCCSEKLWVDASTLASFSWRLSSLVGAWRQAGQCLVPAW